MAADRIITCENVDGVSLTFSETGFNPFLLAKASGIYDANNSIYTSNNTMIDGAEYQGSVMSTRNIVLTIKDKKPFADNRDILSVLFDKKAPGLLTVFDEDHERQIEYYVESISATAKPDVRTTTVSLLCPNPYFYDPYETRQAIMDIQPGFEFPHEFIEDGEEFSWFNPSRIINMINDSADDEMGLTITVTCIDDVVDPAVVKIDTNEQLALSGFTLHPGDTLIFTTTIGHKNVQLIHDGVATDINQYLTDDSVFYQLTRGENHFGIIADTGRDYMITYIACRYKYLRA